MFWKRTKIWRGFKTKFRDITGPISYLWEKIERNRTGESNEPMDIEESALTMQKAMMLVSQASNAITYQRRLGVLKGFTDVKAAKGMLVKHAEKLSTEPTKLFGQDFKSSPTIQIPSKLWNSLIRKKGKNIPFEKAPLLPNKRTKERSDRFSSEETEVLSTTTQGIVVATQVSSAPTLNMLETTGRLQEVHSLLENLFAKVKVNNYFAGRIKQFLQNWQKLRNDKNVLRIVKGWEIPLITKPTQQKVPHAIQFSKTEEQLVDLEVANMLRKGTIRIAIPKENQLLSNIFIRPTKDGEFRPIINLKRLNQFVPYQHFKMEGLRDVKNMLSDGDLMCKLDVKDAYFTVPLSTRSRKLVRFRWKGKLYEFLCLAFGLGPAPRIFTKLLKVPISILRRLNIRLIIYLDDLLLMGSNYQEICLARDSYFPFPPARPHDKLEEVYLGTPDKIGIFGDNYRQQLHDTISAGNKGKKPDIS